MESDPYVRELTDRVAKDPEDYTLRLRLGLALFEKQRYREALPQFQKARLDDSIRSEAMELQERTLKALNRV